MKELMSSGQVLDQIHLFKSSKNLSSDLKNGLEWLMNEGRLEEVEPLLPYF